MRGVESESKTFLDFSARPAAAIHAAAAIRLLAPPLTASGAPGRTHVLRVPGVVGCCCAAAPGAGGGAAAEGDVNGSPLQLHLHLAAARTLRHGGTAHQRCVPAGRPWPGARILGRGAADARKLGIGLPGCSRGALKPAAKALLAAGEFPPAPSRRSRQVAVFLEVVAVASRSPPRPQVRRPEVLVRCYEACP